mmetsp:Transcript_43983/g.50618  ORF Transcript_43983/g.50618 Transcript_43983/m.50618 type:complete len:366 (-) Transcript_43983:258-1355(-)
MGALRDAVDWYENTYEDASGYFASFIEAHPIWAAIIIFAIIVTFFESYERYVQRKHVRKYLTTCLKELGNQKTELKITENLSDVLKQVLTSIGNCEREEMRGYEYWNKHFVIERTNLEKIIGEIVNLGESKLKTLGGPKLKIQEMIGKSDDTDERLIKRYQQVLKLYINSHDGKDQNWVMFVFRDFLPLCRKNEQVGEVVRERLQEASSKNSAEDNEKLATAILEALAYFDPETGQVLQFENYKEIVYGLTSLPNTKKLYETLIKFALESEKQEFAEEDRQHIAIRLIETFPEAVQDELIQKENKEMIDFFNKIDPTFYTQLVSDHKAIQEQQDNEGSIEEDGEQEEEKKDADKKSKKKKKGKKE